MLRQIFGIIIIFIFFLEQLALYYAAKIDNILWVLYGISIFAEFIFFVVTIFIKPTIIYNMITCTSYNESALVGALLLVHSMHTILVIKIFKFFQVLKNVIIISDLTLIIITFMLQYFSHMYDKDRELADVQSCDDAGIRNKIWVNIKGEISEITCSICLEDYNDNDIVGKLICGHVFHEDCIGNWESKNDTCPLCREIIF